MFGSLEMLASCSEPWSESRQPRPGNGKWSYVDDHVVEILGADVSPLQHRRPGILVLINDADWELEGEDKYELKDRDSILFVSTLHGG